MKIENEVFDNVSFNDSQLVKPAILDWICNKFNLPKYNHSFRDQWIYIGIWDNILSVSLDKRDESQAQLLELVPREYIGCDQVNTGKRVNLDSLYFHIDKEFEIEYPEIIKITLYQKHKKRDDDGDIFYTYTHLIHLSDGSKLQHYGYEGTPDLKLNESWSLLKNKIQFRHIYKLLHLFNNLTPNSQILHLN
jgi:hypothetical protein